MDGMRLLMLTLPERALYVLFVVFVILIQASFCECAKNVVGFRDSYEVMEVSTKDEDNNEYLLRLLQTKSESGDETGGVLGGIFMNGDASGESVFSAFHIHEAVRLVIRTRDSDHGEQRALQIGLGVGIVPTALRKHNLLVDVVEIDYEVVDLAKSFFGFDASRTYVEDASHFLNRTCQEQQLEGASLEKPYDFVIHDVWNGDFMSSRSQADMIESSSSLLYMLETFVDIQNCLLRDDGVLVLNYYGIVEGDDFRAILYTLKSVFPSIRVFHDGNRKESSSGLNDSQLQPNEDIPYNLIVFATKDSESKLKFRDAHEGDYLGSTTIRYDALNSMFENEISIDSIFLSGESEKVSIPQNDDLKCTIPILSSADGGISLLWSLQQHVREAHKKARKIINEFLFHSQ